MTVKQIADKVAWFFQKPRADFLDDAGDDVIIQAMNTTRFEAERLHDFVNAQGMATLSVDPVTGGDLSVAVSLLGDTASTEKVLIKSLTGAYLQDPDSPVTSWPLAVEPKRLLNLQAKEIGYRYRGVPTPFAAWDVPLVRYADETRNFASGRPYKLYWQGNRIFIDPRPTKTYTVRLDCNMWLKEYLPNTSVSVATSSTASTAVTLTAAAPSDLIVGSVLLGRFVTAVSGTNVTLNGNANQTIAADTVIPYSNMGSLDVETNESYEDFICAQAPDYLLYGAVVMINYRETRFISGQEGRISPPEKLRDKALTSLINQDDYYFEQSFTPQLLRQ